MFTRSPKPCWVSWTSASPSKKSTVLIRGESGTGKEMIARAIHFNSTRKEARFVTVDCGALNENLLESEMFGHVRGAFTGAVQSRKGYFEVADGGTLFLDEIGNISLGVQSKLLRVLQEREFAPVGSTTAEKTDVRIIAATDKDLEALTANGKFREDHFYRLNIFPIRVPPLRERREDIPLLAAHFLKKLSREMESPARALSPKVVTFVERNEGRRQGRHATPELPGPHAQVRHSPSCGRRRGSSGSRYWT